MLFVGRRKPWRARSGNDSRRNPRRDRGEAVGCGREEDREGSDARAWAVSGGARAVLAESGGTRALACWAAAVGE